MLPAKRAVRFGANGIRSLPGEPRPNDPRTSLAPPMSGEVSEIGGERESRNTVNETGPKSPFQPIRTMPASCGDPTVSSVCACSPLFAFAHTMSPKCHSLRRAAPRASSATILKPHGEPCRRVPRAEYTQDDRRRATTPLARPQCSSMPSLCGPTTLTSSSCSSSALLAARIARTLHWARTRGFELDAEHVLVHGVPGSSFRLTTPGRRS
jgi:hypothetical protein